jgi:hypothetical protein
MTPYFDLSMAFRIELLFGELKIPFPEVCNISIGTRNHKVDVSDTHKDSSKQEEEDNVNPNIVNLFQPYLSDKNPLMGEKITMQKAGGIMDNPTVNGSRCNTRCMKKGMINRTPPVPKNETQLLIIPKPISGFLNIVRSNKGDFILFSTRTNKTSSIIAKQVAIIIGYELHPKLLPLPKINNIVANKMDDSRAPFQSKGFSLKSILSDT